MPFLNPQEDFLGIEPDSSMSELYIGLLAKSYQGDFYKGNMSPACMDKLCKIVCDMQQQSSTSMKLANSVFLHTYDFSFPIDEPPIQQYNVQVSVLTLQTGCITGTLSFVWEMSLKDALARFH